MYSFNPTAINDVFFRTNHKQLAYREDNDFIIWRKKVFDTLEKLLGNKPESVPINIRIESERETEIYKEIRYIFTSEERCDVPCHLLIPRTEAAPYPLVICLQGHSSGMHISLGRAKFEGDDEIIKGDRDYAIQAIKQGYAALVLEQRCFGERIDDKTPEEDIHTVNRCHIASMSALLIGRTMIGERVWDISRAIDSLNTFKDFIDIKRIGCMGNSGGGTIAFFAACMDERIKVCMSSCYVCSLEYSLMEILHCTCNYVPNMLKYFDLGDIAGLIAPRPLIIVAGRHDEIFPLEGTKKAYTTIEKIYKKVNASDNLRLVIGEGGHRFYADQAWEAFRKVSKWQ